MSTSSALTKNVLSDSLFTTALCVATSTPLIEIEEALLGTILVEPDLLLEVLDLQGQFSHSNHRRIYSAMLCIHAKGRKADANTLAYEMHQSGDLSRIGGKHKLVQLMERINISGSIKQYADIIRDNYQRSAISDSLKRIADQIEQGGHMSDDLLARLEQQIQAARIGTGQPSPDNRLKLDLHMLLNETDPIRKARLKADISSRYRLNKATVEELLHCLKEQVTTPQRACSSLGEFLTQSDTALEYLVPGMLPKGESILLAAQPKCGKTLLSLDLAYAVATGSEFLGERVPQGKVLLISCDESPQSLRSKLERRGFTPEQHGDQIKISTRWNLSQIETLEEILESFRPDLVIIDSLKRVSQGSNISENSAEFADNVYLLKETLNRYGAAGILIHHTNKDKEATGVYRVRGSSALSGAVWGIWQLSHILKPDPTNKKKQIVDPKESKRKLEIQSRDAEGQTLTIDSDPEDFHWMRVECNGESSDNQTMRQRIRNILELNRDREGLTVAEIRELLELEPDNRAVYSALDRMVERREIQRKQSTVRRVKIYCLPKDTPPPDSNFENAEYHAETETQQELQDIQQLFSTPPEIIQHPLAENPVLNNSNPVPANDSGDIQHPLSETKGGGSSGEPLKVGDRVRINCPGSKRHGKTATIKHVKNGRGVNLADLAVDGEGFKYWEAQLDWLERLV